MVIINQKLASSAWGTENPVGRNLVLDYQRGPYPYEVVGVVRDDRHDGPRSEPVPEIFIPHAQNPYLVMNVIARTTLDPVAVAQTARANALRVDPDQPVHSVTTMDQLLGDAVQLDRFAMLLITLFAVAGSSPRPAVSTPCSPTPWCNGVVKLRCGWRSGRRRGVSHGRS